MRIFLLCLLPGILLLASCPPLWNGIDAALYIICSPLQMYPHWPPLYPMFVGSVFKIGAILEQQSLSLSEPIKHFTDIALYTVVIVQHLLLAGGICFFLNSLPLTPRRRLYLTVLLIAISAPLYFHTHGVYSESLAIVFLFFMLGIVLRISENPGDKTLYTGYAAATLAMAFSRHPVVVCIPFLALFSLLSRRSPGTRPALCVGVSGAVCVLYFFLNFAFCKISGGPCVSSIGLGPAHRWILMGRENNGADREYLVSRLTKATDDPSLQKIIPLAFSAHDPWDDLLKGVAATLPAEQRNNAQAESQKLVNKLFRLYLFHPDWLLVSYIGGDAKTYLLSSHFSKLESPVSWMAKLIDWYPKSDFAPWYASLVEISPQTSEQIARFSSVAWKILAYSHFLSDGLLALLTSVLIWFGRGRDTSVRLCSFALSALAVALIHLLIVSIIIPYDVRYGLPHGALINAGFIAALANFFAAGSVRKSASSLSAAEYL